MNKISDDTREIRGGDCAISDRDSLDVELLCGQRDASRDFAAIGNKNTFDAGRCRIHSDLCPSEKAAILSSHLESW